MEMVMITAAVIGGTMFAGSLIGFLFEKIPDKWNDGIMGFASGIMLAAAVLGLIVPAAEQVGKQGLWMVAIGMLSGAVFLNVMDKLMPHLHHLSGVDSEEHKNNGTLDKVMLFVFAIAIHKLPEGLAAGVGFGAGDLGSAIAVAAGIAVQNVPEGMIIISPMLHAGVKKKRAVVIALAIALIEILGTFLGYAASVVSTAALPVLLSFAGGTMLYVIGDEMIPETHSHGYSQIATYSLILGFIAMLFMEMFF